MCFLKQSELVTPLLNCGCNNLESVSVRKGDKLYNKSNNSNCFCLVSITVCILSADAAGG